MSEKGTNSVVRYNKSHELFITAYVRSSIQIHESLCRKQWSVCVPSSHDTACIHSFLCVYLYFLQWMLLFVDSGVNAYFSCEEFLRRTVLWLSSKERTLSFPMKMKLNTSSIRRLLERNELKRNLKLFRIVLI